MSKVIFLLDGLEIIIQCSKDEKIKNIFQRYADRINININSLIFLYDGKPINFDLSFNEQANIIDKKRNEMKIFVYKNEISEFICPKCGVKIKLNKMEDIILSFNNIKDVINGIILNIDKIINVSSNNSINFQLKNVNLLLNKLNDDVKILNEKFKNLLINNINIIKNRNQNNYITAEIDINEENINKKIRILNSYEEFMRTNNFTILKNEYKNEDAIKKVKIEINGQLKPFKYFYKFKSKGKYIIKYSFNNKINNTSYMFCECKLLTNINLIHFNTKNVINMSCMFSKCISLNNIDLSNIKTNKVTNFHSMFSECSSLSNINLSSFKTNNAITMSYMFYKCSSLNEINLSNFHTKKLVDMHCMFYECSSLAKINLSHFTTKNVTNMGSMFYRCCSLKNIDLSNFKTKKVKNMSYMFSQCSSLTNINILNFRYKKYTIKMNFILEKCNELSESNIVVKDKILINNIKYL